ncbi:potassium-transporting ATPase subunit KdpC [Streptomyces sp. H10-C2]|uniref:potassium-transporting ATPase subunit KdpC n=1 Tax=unclassified Streptomyces TaxID=2593676 RepID=UPI0024BAEA02|nr:MULTISPECIES: potassium-transporting ATPase subunit KdpC [unclassified Streptomyces]MDJ0341536.1 potassium-transporting ATPase subunit KdpC [Streptomyces sp. PH10-H1]MDJ0371362.1 potassium-transporting ATPase subunit KdpC [Streptomyces sp. H10-C2]
MNTSVRSTARLMWGAFRALLVLSVICGVLYPLAVTGIAQAAFNNQANGSQVKADGRVVGSTVLGQTFDLPKKNPADAAESVAPDPKWFQPRPSAADAGAGAGAYDPTYSGASNLAVTGKALTDLVRQRKKDVAAFNGVTTGQVPADAVTASASGLDPDISPDYARIQIARVARANHLTDGQVLALVKNHTDGRPLGILGEAKVNVLELNIALHKLAG